MENAEHHEADNNGNASCSACKYQRKRCRSDCVLRRHFPADKGEEFRNAQKIFGIANMTKKIKEANNSIEVERGIVESLSWEGQAWANDPVYGPYGVFRALQEELRTRDTELNEAKMQMQMMQAAYVERSHIPNGHGSVSMMNANYPHPHHSGLFPDAYVGNGFQQRFVHHGSNNGMVNGMVNNQGIMMQNGNGNGNWGRNAIQQWREQQQGNPGPSSSVAHTSFSSETERNRAGQGFGSEKPN